MTDLFRILVVLCLVGPMMSLAFAATGAQTPNFATDGRPIQALTLIGVLIAREQAASVAVLKDDSTGQTISVGIGENVRGMKLVQIFANRVVLSDGPKAYEIFFGSPGNTSSEDRPAPKVFSPKEGAEKKAKTEDLIAPSVKREYKKDDLINKIQHDWPSLLRASHVAPHFAGSEIDGVQIVKWPLDSDLLRDMGLQEGDVIKQVNEIRLNKIDVLLQLERVAREAKVFDLVVEREGKLRRHSYTIR